MPDPHLPFFLLQATGAKWPSRAVAPAFAALLAALPLAACGSVTERGLLGRIESGCDGGGGPVAGASVRVECPGEAAPRMVASSDSSGYFITPLPSAAVPKDCVLVVERAGYRVRSYLLGDVCFDLGSPSAKDCKQASVAVRLVPEGASR